ncbi:MAG: hypothetical protein ABFR63_09120 [Thermodesulfobacteriota bacterium]
MQCERLIKQVKSWYIHVSNETMAPARMISFMKEHAEDCPVCQEDPDLQEEIEKITEMILPESKIPKAVRMQQEQEQEQEELENSENEEDGEDGEDDDDVDIDVEDTAIE